jgi:hypothetical protein
LEVDVVVLVVGATKKPAHPERAIEAAVKAMAMNLRGAVLGLLMLKSFSWFGRT